nr:aconitase family protein [uncultured Roseateles sp.]
MTSSAPSDERIAFDRILFLSSQPELVENQLQGRDLALVEAGPLRDDVSTDEITPIPVLAYYDERLGSYPYLGVKAGERCPLVKDSVRNGGFQVTVAGKRYGKGSSREHSPVAERHAGIRLVIAESFERIYRQNADNVGLFTSTDFSLIERIQRGEAIAIAELVASRDALAAAILRHGGLLRYGQARMRTVSLPAAVEHGHPQTLFEKIIARHTIRTDDTPAELPLGQGGFVRADWRFIHEYYTGMCGHMLDGAFGESLQLSQPETALAFEDHLSYAHRSPVHIRQGLMPEVRHLSAAHRRFAARHGLRDHGYLPGSGGHQGNGEGSEGISHAMMAELYALPGQVVVGTDSHTPHSGALGCVAFGVGTTDMANAMVTGVVRFTQPPSLKVELQGPLPAGVTAKDVVLHLLAQPRIRAGAGVGKVFEFIGSAIAQLSTDERATLTNMTAELGGFCGIVAPDAETVRFLKQRRGVDFSLQPWMASDPGADYAETVQLDCRALSPMVARPGDPGNGLPLAEVLEPVRIDIAYGGSCTAGKREDFDHYHAVLSWAAARGLRVAPHVKLYLQFGTAAVRDYCQQRGYLAAFEAVGAELLQPACGACANCGPGSSTESTQVTVSAINRNFPGRSGPGQVWLASPPTVAASAIAGHIVSFADLQAGTTHPH